MSLTNTAVAAPTMLLMTADEAKRAVATFRDYIRSAEHYATNARKIALDLYEREGWRALGYENWRTCAVAELGLSQAQVYRLLTAAEIDRDIVPALADFSHHEKNLPEAALRPLAQLEAPEARQAAARAALETTGGKVPTAAQMRQAVEQVRPPAPRDLGICARCSGTWGKPGSLVTDAGKFCQDCATIYMETLAKTQAAVAAGRVAPTPAVPTEYTSIHVADTGGLGQQVRDSYSADRIGADRPIKKPVEYDSKLWIGTSDREAVRLVPRADYQGTPVTYADRCVMTQGSGPRAFYASVIVHYRGDEYVLTHEKLVVMPPCEHCGAPATARRNLRGLAANRCAACDASEARLQEQEIAEQSADPIRARLSTHTIQALVSVGAAVDSASGVVYPPRGSGEAPAVLDEAAARAAMGRWQALAPATTDADDARRRIRAAELVRELARLLREIETNDLAVLSQAIVDLSEAPERGERPYIVNVLWAYLDLELDEEAE